MPANNRRGIGICRDVFILPAAGVRPRPADLLPFEIGDRFVPTMEGNRRSRKTPPPERFAHLEAEFGPFISLSHQALGPWLETARVMAGLELIITVDSGPAHAAASLAGPDVWVLQRHEAHAACWRWGDPAWYPDARVRRGDCRATGAPVAGRNDRCSVQQPNDGWPKSTPCSNGTEPSLTIRFGAARRGWLCWHRRLGIVL